MSHDTHDTHHDVHGGHEGEKKSVTGMRSAFWFVIILAGLYLAAINFVKVESGGEGHKEGYHKQEEATSNQTLMNEGGTGKTEDSKDASPATKEEPASRPGSTPQGADTASAK